VQVYFDLRPSNLVILQEQKVDPIRLLCVLLFFIFFVFSLVNIFFIGTKYISVQDDLRTVRNKKNEQEVQKKTLDKTLADLQALRNRMVVFLDFTKMDIPTVEVLAALDYTVPPNIVINSVLVTPGNVNLQGSAINDEDITIFASKLDNMKTIFHRASAPTTKRTESGARLIWDFQIICDSKTIPDIGANYTNLFDTEGASQ
jgi:Fimbrial assembly protein (PilN).